MFRNLHHVSEGSGAEGRLGEAESRAVVECLDDFDDRFVAAPIPVGLFRLEVSRVGVGARSVGAGSGEFVAEFVELILRDVHRSDERRIVRANFE